MKARDAPLRQVGTDIVRIVDISGSGVLQHRYSLYCRPMHKRIHVPLHFTRRQNIIFILVVGVCTTRDHARRLVKDASLLFRRKIQTGTHMQLHVWAHVDMADERGIRGLLRVYCLGVRLCGRGPGRLKN